MPEVRLLDEESWNRLQDAAERYERDCAEAFPRRIRDYLPRDGDPLRPLMLDELLRVDLELRWRRGMGARVEEYVRDFPELSANPDRLAALVAEEFRVRSRFAHRPEKDEYLQRFPQIRERLAGLAPPDAQEFKTMQSTVEIPFATAGNIKKVRRIGEGGFGEVWECRAPGGVPVAVKRIYGTVSPELIEREKQSLDLICSGKFRHPFLLQVFGWWVQDGLLHIVMELADESLDDRLRAAKAAGRTGLSADELRLVMRDAADALDFLNHQCRILHRDVKPANMLLMGGRLKLCDFGLARMTQNLSVGAGKTLGAGTPVCIAPEIVQGYQSMQSDQYSLAASYYLLRTGRPLFRGKVAEIRDQQVHAIPELDKPEFSEGEKRVLAKALAKAPTDRYPTTSDFVDDLLAAAGRRSPPPGDAASAPPHPVRALGAGEPSAASLPAETHAGDPWTPVRRVAAARIGVKSRPRDLSTPPPPLASLRRWWFAALAFLAVFAVGVLLGGLLFR
jgi:hypothetical protein